MSNILLPLTCLQERGVGVGWVGGKMKYYCQTNPFHCKIAGCNNLGPACIA